MGQEDELEVRRLIEELTGVLNAMTNIEEKKQAVCEETLDKLRRLNVDADVVRQIMRRADELKGRTDRYATSEPLYETIRKVFKE